MTPENRAVNEQAFEAEPTSPVGEIEIEGEELDEGRVADDTGGKEEVEPSAVEHPDREAFVPRERFDQVYEKAKTADQLQAQIQVYEKLLTERQTQAEPAGAELPEDYDYWNDETKLLYQELQETKKQNASIQQYIQQTNLQRIQQEFNETLSALESAEGVKFNADYKDAILQQASYIQSGAQAAGYTMPVKEAVQSAHAIVAYNALKKQQAEGARVAEVRNAKAGISAARPAGIVGPSVSAHPGVMSKEEAAERAWRETQGG